MENMSYNSSCRPFSKGKAMQMCMPSLTKIVLISSFVNLSKTFKPCSKPQELSESPTTLFNSSTFWINGLQGSEAF